MNDQATEILIAIVFVLIAALFIVLGTIFYKFFHKIEKKEVLSNKKVSVKNASLYDAVMMQLLCKLKMEVTSCKIIIARFHNGGNFANGYEMKKFTITHETPGGSKEPLMDKCIGVFNSRYAATMLQLVTCEYYCLADITDCSDQAFKHDMNVYGFISTNLFLLKQFDGSDEGFIGVNFTATHVMNAEERMKVMAYIPRILNLLNLQESSLKD